MINHVSLDREEVVKVNGVYKDDTEEHLCCVCGYTIWGEFCVGYVDEQDIEVRPGSWIVTCGAPVCREMIQINPLAYDLESSDE